MARSYPEDRQYNGPALIVVIIAIVVVTAFIIGLLALVRHVNHVERDCIKRNGVEYCREIME